MRQSALFKAPVPRHGPLQWTLLLAFPVLLTTACAESRAGAENADEAMLVRRGQFVGRALLSGQLEALRAEQITVPRSPSWQVQVRWMAENGSHVEAGKRVLELDNSALSGELADKRLALLAAINDRAKRRAQLAAEEAEKAFQHESQALELRKAEIDASIPPELLPSRQHHDHQLALERALVAAQKAADELVAQRRRANEELAVLAIQVEQAEGDVAAAEEVFDSFIVRAPASGIVVVEEHPWERRTIVVGDTVFAGMAVLTLPDLESLAVEALLADVDDGHIQVGMEAVCTLDALPEISLGCRVTSITPIAQARGAFSEERTFRVGVELDGADPERMLPGMSVRVDVVTETLEDVLLAPRSGLEPVSEPPRARLADGRLVEVELGPCDGLRCVVESGLSAGDRLRRHPVVEKASI